MDWNYCEEKFIKKVESDPSKINSLLETSELRKEYLKSKEVTKKNISFIVEGYYEIIKELLTALLLSRGLRSKNHQCLISFFYKNYPDYEAEAYLISQLCFLRNRLNYYGELIDSEFYKKNYKEFDKIIKLLKGLIVNKK
jgi:hypothetical protein